MSSAAFSITLKEVFQNKKVLISLLRSFALVFIIPFLMSLLFYYVSLQQTYINTIELNTHVLDSASTRVDLRMQEVSNIAHEIVHNPAVRAFQGNTAGFAYPNTYKMIQVRSSLGNYSMTQNFVDHYFLFFNASQIVMNNTFIYTYDQFFDQHLVFPQDRHEQIQQAIRNRTLPTGLYPAQEMTILGKSGRYLMLLQPLYDLGDGYLCILINEETFTSMFDTISLGDTGCVYVMGSGDVPLTSFQGAQCDLEATRSAIKDYVSRYPGKTDFILNTVNGDMLVTYLETEATGLTYITVQPMTIVMAKVNVYRMIMLAAMGISLVIGLMLCYRQARQLSTPMLSLMDAVGLYEGDSKEALNIIEDMVVTLRSNNESLQRLAKEHKVLLRSSFASRLLRGNFANEAEALRICHYVCPEHADFSFVRTLLLHLDPLADDSDEEIRLKLIGSMKLALKEVLEGFLPNCLPYDVDEETLALIIFDKDREEIDEIYQQLLEACPPYLRESIRAFGGWRRNPPLPKVSRSFESARITMMIHQLNPAQNKPVIIWADKNVTAMQYFFPADVRYRLTKSITHGMHNDVTSILNELFQVNLVERPVRPAIFRLFVSELLSTAVGCMPLLPQGIAEEELHEHIVSITTAPAKHQCELLLDFFRLLTSCAESSQNDTVNQIQQVVNYIGTHYKESNLSLTSIAEEFSLNASVLSTMFKQQTNKNLSTYLEDLRIQEAQRLLRTTNWTINRIAEEVGYLSANSSAVHSAAIQAIIRLPIALCLKSRTTRRCEHVAALVQLSCICME